MICGKCVKQVVKRYQQQCSASSAIAKWWQKNLINFCSNIPKSNFRPSKPLKPPTRHRCKQRSYWFSKFAQLRRLWTPHFVLIVTLMLTSLATHSVVVTAKARDRLQFENVVQRTQDHIQTRMEAYIALLQASSGLFAASDQVDRNEFHTYIDRLDLPRHYPGIQGIGFSTRVLPEDRESFIARMEQQGWSNFAIKPGFSRSEYNSIIYIEPLDRRNQAAVGFDMFLEPVRRAAMIRARDTKAPAASGRVTLVQEIDEQKQPGFLIYVPVYQRRVALDTIGQRRAALQGFVFAAFRADDLLQSIFGDVQHPDIDFQIYDGTQLQAKNLLHSSRANGIRSQPLFTTIQPITIAGQTWSIYYASRPDSALASGSSIGAYILLTGIVVSLLLFNVTRSQALAQQQIQRLNTGLEHQVQSRTAQLQQAIDFEATLKRIADKARDSLDENQILQTVVAELSLSLGLSGCNAARYNLTEGTSTICYEYAIDVPVYRHRAICMADYPEIYQQLLNGQYFQFCSLFPNPVRGRVALLACPIINDVEVLGDLWLINSANHTFNQLEIRLVQQVANQCAIAIRQARLYQAARTQVEKLEQINHLKDDFLSTVSHELRTPMSNMKMAIQMLKNSPLTERGQRYLDILQAECNREIELINDLLDLQRLETANNPNKLVDFIDLADWLTQIIEPFRVRTQQRQQTLSATIPLEFPKLASHRSSLERIITELLNNACKYTAAGGEITCRIDYNSTKALTVFKVSNTTEIPAAQLPLVFDKFYRLPHADPWKQGGTGLGLALVLKLVEQLQGTIEVESSGGWTNFVVQLPQLQPTAASDGGSADRVMSASR